MGPISTHSKEKSNGFSVLLKDTSVMAGDLNPRPADQKHQGLTLVLLPAPPGSFWLCRLMRSAIYSHKWPTVLVLKAKGKPRNFEANLCGSL